MSEPSDTPVTFSREEVRQIRRLICTPRAQVGCPLCGKTLLLVGPIKSEGTVGATYEVTCRPCHRSAIITDAPWLRGPEA